MKLEDMRLPDLQAKYKEVCGGPTRCPNRVFLIRRIQEALAAKKNAQRAARAEGSIDALRAQYREVVGRETASTDRPYLLWKIAMARRGKVRVGPARPRRAGAAPRILPLRLDEVAIAAMDAAWRRHGLPTRTAFLRRAIRRELAALGERAAAARFDEEGTLPQQECGSD